MGIKSLLEFPQWTNCQSEHYWAFQSNNDQTQLYHVDKDYEIQVVL